MNTHDNLEEFSDPPNHVNMNCLTITPCRMRSLAHSLALENANYTSAGTGFVVVHWQLP